MTIIFENEQTIPFDFDCEKTAEEVINRVLDDEGCPYESEVSLTFVDNEEIHRLNKEFRQIDRPTDVLSFPMIDFAAPADYAPLEAEDAEGFNPETGELMLGDIVISVERAKEQAAEYGHDLRREISFLIAHSMLHLLGYDHMEPEEAAVMEAKQEAALTALGITR
ncbi:MAG: rRNA maturation RNase YbeY [Lachnospiraceae bacterium]|nr:rRNA maturation RNase YbeY [Lachnospiraceae bacterium]